MITITTPTEAFAALGLAPDEIDLVPLALQVLRQRYAEHTRIFAIEQAARMLAAPTKCPPDCWFLPRKAANFYGTELAKGQVIVGSFELLTAGEHYFARHDQRVINAGKSKVRVRIIESIGRNNLVNAYRAIRA